MAEVEKAVMTLDDLVALTGEVKNAQTLEEITEINKKLLGFEMNGYKASLVTAIKTRRREIVDNLVKQKQTFNALYFLVCTATGNSFKQAGKLLYALKEYDVLTKAEINYLFHLYENRKKKMTTGNQVDGDIPDPTRDIPEDIPTEIDEVYDIV